MGESRQDLLKWINGLLKLNYTKIEEMGTGAAYTQIFDSIYGDVHLHKVKFETKQEYEYMSNFKVLQDTFTLHKIDKVIPVDKLVKCKMQDNLEFTQWVKKYWDTTHQTDEYDALARRKAKGGAAASSSSSAAAAAPKPAAAAPARAPAASAPAKTVVPARATTTAAAAPAASTVRKTTVTSTPSKAPVSSSSAKPAGGAAHGAAVNGTALAESEEKVKILETHVTELKVTVDNLEKERDFYFNKLREIEILVQTLEESKSGDSATFLVDVKKILYSTEDGFEVPADDVPISIAAIEEPIQDEY